MQKEEEENILRRKIFGLRSKRRLGEAMKGNILGEQIFGLKQGKIDKRREGNPLKKESAKRQKLKGQKGWIELLSTQHLDKQRLR